MEFNALERATLRDFTTIYGNDEPRLAAQIAAACPVSRLNTSGGFFTEVVVNQAACEKMIMWGPLGDHYVHVAGMEHGLGLMLFFKEGYLSLIEGYSPAAEDTSDIDFSTVAFGPLTEIIVPTAEAVRPATSEK